jgi:L-ribulose-5-phosphate 3-epimerase
MIGAATLPVGMNARLFASNWRPVADEIAFAAEAGFDLLQLPGPVGGLGIERLGDLPVVVGAMLRDAGLGAVMEMAFRIDTDGRTSTGGTTLTAVRANLAPRAALGATAVHIHPVPHQPDDADGVRRLEDLLARVLPACVEAAADVGVSLSVEHNEPRLALLSDPQRVAALLDAVDGLGLVWDLNHTAPDRLPQFVGLAPRMRLVHVSDTPLPQLNGHQPIGAGSLDVGAYLSAALDAGFRGPLLLEIGGHPLAGGFGRDTDEALVDSLGRLRTLLATGSPEGSNPPGP